MSTSPAAHYQWRPTGAPFASSRTDDIWFLDADRGWTVNSNGHILHTVDGGDTWERQFNASTPQATYLRCVGFADERLGWVGTLTASRRLYHTSDGGTSWVRVANLPPEAPPAICGLSVVDKQVVYGSGTNFPDRPAGVIKTVDGGANWTATDMGEHATLLVDVLFTDEQHGWVVGGKAEVANPTRDDVVPVVLRTEDGGATWENRLAAIAAELPKGEWGWKVQFLDENVGFVSLENDADGAVLKTLDGGVTWTRKPVNDPQGNANLEGIGFVDDKLGWTGGWGDSNFMGGFTSETRDGGETWTDANEVGMFLNRFRFIREPKLVGYASGDTVYKYSDAPLGEAEQRSAAARKAADPYTRTPFPVRIPVEVPPGAQHVRVDVWDRFGDHLVAPLDESGPAAGTLEASWTGETESGPAAKPGIYIYRVTIDDSAESGTVLVEK
jgi:photosystem II stability/assembly factor-like uncharacterized protein